MKISSAPSAINSSKHLSFLNAHIDIADNVYKNILELGSKKHARIAGDRQPPKEIFATITTPKILSKLSSKILKLLTKPFSNFRIPSSPAPGAETRRPEEFNSNTNSRCWGSPPRITNPSLPSGEPKPPRLRRKGRLPARRKYKASLKFNMKKKVLPWTSKEVPGRPRKKINSPKKQNQAKV